MAKLPQPDFVCMDCAKEFMRYVMGSDAKWIDGFCGVCGSRDRKVTNPNNCAGLKRGWQLKAEKIPKLQKPKAQLEMF